MTTYQDEVNGRISMATSFNVKLDINEHIFERENLLNPMRAVPLRPWLTRSCKTLSGVVSCS